MKKLNFVINILFCFFLVVIANATEEGAKIITLDEIVVSANHIDKKLGKTPASISIITAGQIEDMGANNIVDIVKTIPGATKDSDSRERVTIRGNRSSQSAGVLVLVDGVPLNSGISNYVEFDAIPVSDIKQIEVLRSSAAMIFGPDAARGAINIITKKGKTEKPQFKTAISYGSWNSKKASASIDGMVKNWDYRLGGSFFNTDGYENDEKKRSAVRLNTGYNFSKDSRVGFSFSHQETDYDTIYAKTKWQIDNYREESIFPKSATDDTLVHFRENENENSAFSIDFAHKEDKYFANSLISYDKTDHIYQYLPKCLDAAASKTSSYYDYKEDRDSDRLLANASMGYYFNFNNDVRYTPTLGVDYEKNSFDQLRTYPWSPTPFSSSQTTAVSKANIDSKKERFGLFLDNEIAFENFEFNFAIRADKVKYDIENQVPQKISNDITDYSWNITPLYYLTPSSSLYFSASKSYWHPALIYYKYAMEKDSPLNKPEDLKSEEYLTYELGYKAEFSSKLNLALSVYSMNVKDKYMSLYDGSSWKGYKNIGDADHKGVELEANGKLSSFFEYRFQGAYQSAKWDKAIFRAYEFGTSASSSKDNFDISGKTVPHVPEFTSTLGLDFYFLEFFKLSADANYYGEQEIDVLNRYQTDAYTTLDLRLSYNRKNYKIWLSAFNLLDRKEENIFNEGGAGFPDGSPNHTMYYPLDGRYIEAGISFIF
ncbi:MAG: TonB-dependent receptor [Desulfobacula sp.]|uniref:TonB-dependent receptor n=1 Tax=Desulfobacula sp. TaxID=2593537 RepID=UPI0025B88A6F|nr:TonB-dependent receptor [Desulfobacula sp.]MCD4720492.1 TonB-dependent receptor [Desulfobacula sp.]